MEFFRDAYSVRLLGHTGKYLWADDDHKSVSQKKGQDSYGVIWRVEVVPERNTVRLKSVYDLFLMASDYAFLLGATGKRVLQSFASKADSSLEWEPVSAGTFVKLKTKGDKFLRANGGFPPYRNSVTHDVPVLASNQNVVLWEVEVVRKRDAVSMPPSRIASPRVSNASRSKSPPPAPPPAPQPPAESSDDDVPAAPANVPKPHSRTNHAPSNLEIPPTAEFSSSASEAASPIASPPPRRRARPARELEHSPPRRRPESVRNVPRARHGSPHDPSSPPPRRRASPPRDATFDHSPPPPRRRPSPRDAAFDHSPPPPRRRPSPRDAAFDHSPPPPRRRPSPRDAAFDHSPPPPRRRPSPRDAAFDHSPPPPRRRPSPRDAAFDHSPPPPRRRPSPRDAAFDHSPPPPRRRPSPRDDAFDHSPPPRRRAPPPAQDNDSAPSGYQRARPASHDDSSELSPEPSAAAAARRNARPFDLGDSENSARSSSLNEKAKSPDIRRIFYSVAEDDGEVLGHDDESFGTFMFRGHGLDELTEELQRATGITDDIILCMRNPLSAKLYKMRLALPPNKAPLSVVIVRTHSQFGKTFTSQPSRQR